MSKIRLHVNRADSASGQIQVNITTQVNASKIRKAVHNGREHWILPSYTLPANVIMNNGLYPASEIDAHYAGLEGTLAPLGHPTVDGQFVSAFSPEGINAAHVGAFNRNVKKSGNRIYVEKWVDVEVAKLTDGGRELLERVEALEKGEDVPPIHTSVAVFLEQMEANEQQQAAGAQWVAKIHGMDHDAILLNEVGAATPEQGVGLMVNADAATPLKANAGVLAGESFREREQRIDRAARERFAPGPDDYAWVADFTSEQAIIVRNGGSAEVYGYSIENGKVTFTDTGSPVERQESWVATVTNSFKRFFTHQARPDKTMEGDMPLTTEEKAGLVTDIGAAVAANIAEQIKPLQDAVTDLQANHKALSESLTANQKAEEAEKRKAVAAKHGDVVANALSGDALDVMFKSLGEAAPLGTNAAQDSAEDGAPDPATYFGGK
ncbi:hypothetical protein [Pusillimonas sp. ANT_WB101]|uniref:hypothetical protein n=1 Tax=Pusillimonas sp. ANT_WB101 TaxID=2597356 RepID=UPI0011EFFF4B|nr:hypothetical protein [Pusillimonas sp. ANT_WB101]KAA0910677.1 hypothetical protein FQ179_02020 [Pusillimonas sp. ANT_WB101]